MRLVWLLLVTVVVSAVRGTFSQCWEHPSCQELSSESNMLECIQLCRSDLTSETPVYPGDAHLQLLPPSSPDFTPPFSLSSSSPALPASPLLLPLEDRPPLPAKRSYSMEHFRWGKPVGRKRRPIKVYTSNGPEGDSSEPFPGQMRRQVDNEADEESPGLQGVALQQKKAGYKMKHFRWSEPPASKRYGGFMKSWDPQSHKPLLTLFKNIINKDGHEREGQP